jgi:hypothetical protein
MTRAAALALLAALVPASLDAQDRWETQVRNQMIEITDRAHSAGFSRTSQYYYGRLRQGQSETINLTFATGREYMVIAACDSDCPDVDLSLYEGDGQLFGSDLRSDAFPIVVVPTGHSGTHPVKVSMARCDANPCRYEIAVFTR